MRKASVIAGFFLSGLLSVHTAHAATALTYRSGHFLFTVPLVEIEKWKRPHEVWLYRGVSFTPPAELLVEGDTDQPLPEGITRGSEVNWDAPAIRQTLARVVGEPLKREAGKVTIGRTASGTVVFDGVGLTGRNVNIDELVTLTLAALQQGASDIIIPIEETQPSITFTDPWFAEQGITEVVTIGESDFSNSPNNRRHNIAVGLAKFNGHVIPKDSVFSFVETLGPVNGQTGYKLELVIKGDRTEPDYGGGLCQVSSTAYRGVWEYGFPIVQRRNHSYSVSHYFPQGTDATVYPPYTDIKFLNDSPGALVMQTYAKDDLAYFIYYGTKDSRSSEVFGPYIWDRVGSPPDRIEFTTDLPPGVTKKLGERVPGLKALWFRVKSTSTGQLVEPVMSHYQARPLFLLKGMAAAEAPTPAEIETVLESGD